MKKFKVNSVEDNTDFVVTTSFLELYHAFQGLNTDEGRFIHVIGAPGTGKSSNIYRALNNLELNVHDAIFFLDNVEKGSGEVFDEFFNTMKDNFNVETKEEVYNRASEYDTVLLADKLLDSECLDGKKVGLGRWIEHKGFKSLPFYAFCIIEYFKHRNDLKKLNIILQHSWIFKIRGVKYDLFMDFGLFSKLIVRVLKTLFEVVEISYSEAEIVKIVKNHIKDVDEEQIKLLIKKYGFKPRFILNDLENNSIKLKTAKTRIRTTKPVSKV